MRLVSRCKAWNAATRKPGLQVGPATGARMTSRRQPRPDLTGPLVAEVRVICRPGQ